VTREIFQNAYGRQSAVRAETCEGQLRIGADVPTAREETCCFLRVVQQSKVVGCFPGLQTLIIRGCFVVTPVDMLAVEVANIQTGVGVNRERGGL